MRRNLTECKKTVFIERMPRKIKKNIKIMKRFKILKA